MCRSRKVRCDAEIHIPCTNCITFGCECVLPEAKKRGHSHNNEPKKRIKREDEEDTTMDDRYDESPEQQADTTMAHSNSQASSEPIHNISQVSVPPSLTLNYKSRSRRQTPGKKLKAPLLTFLGASLVGLVAQEVGENHLMLTEDMYEVKDGTLDSVEMEILKLRGCFLLPSRELQLDLIESYFEHVHPLMPVINRTEFMYKFNDPEDSPSLMLLQAVMLCGCRVLKNPQLFDSNGLKLLALMTFFGRAKALYEANYESDPVCIIQTLILIGLFWEGPEDVTKNSYYWTKVAIALAQGFGFQRDVSRLEKQTASDKKIWRRIWWCLFEKDRNVAIAFGRPATIDLNDCDVPMLTEDDFDENDPDAGIALPYTVDRTQVLYFIHLVKLAEITGIIIKHQYSVKSEQLKQKSKFSIIQHCDMLMGIWFTNLPPELVFLVENGGNQNFYCCLLNAQYYNRLYLIHRLNLIRMARLSSTNPNNYKYPSWGISFQAARMISMVLKILLDRDQLQYSPVMYVYILFSAMIMLVYHVDLSLNVVAVTASDSLYVLKGVLKEIAKHYPVATMLVRLFEKYANDRIKRAKVIEKGTKIAEYQEQTASRKTNGEHNQSYPPSVPFRSVSPAPSTASGISPGGGVYPHDISPYKQQQQQQQQHQLQHQTLQHEEKNQRLEELVQLVKSKKNGSDKEDTSPSLTLSFPDVSLVTDNMPNHQNFFENFEPTQLFPDVKQSMTPSRGQSPQPHAGNEFAEMNGEDINMATPNPNFIDSSFVNMNLQSGLENNYLTDDFGSLFNL